MLAKDFSGLLEKDVAEKIGKIYNLAGKTLSV